jgi:hypothetical protein
MYNYISGCFACVCQLCSIVFLVVHVYYVLEGKYRAALLALHGAYLFSFVAGYLALNFK